MIRNLVVVGMGGQGVKLLSTLLRQAIGQRYGRFAGFDERGGAQRYGPVAAAIRFNDRANYEGPLALDFKDGGAHWVVALEASEPLRYNSKLGKGTVLISDSVIVPPTNVRRADGEYFSLEELTNHYEELGCSLFLRDFRKHASEKWGNPLDANLLALGFLLRQMDDVLSLDDFNSLVQENKFSVIEEGYAMGGEK